MIDNNLIYSKSSRWVLYEINFNKIEIETNLEVLLLDVF